MMKKSIIYLSAALLVFSCTNQEAEEGAEDIDSLSTIETEEDLVSDQNPIDSTEVEEKVETIVPPKETKVLDKVTFCDCIKRQKAIDDKLETAETDAEIDQVLADMDELQNGECKELLNDGQTSPDQREERKRKIAKCLGS